MNFSNQSLAYSKTGFFSNLVLDFVHKDEKLKPFVTDFIDKNNILKQIELKRNSFKNREVLVDYLKHIYENNKTNEQLKNIELLAKENCFTITTAHQPNIFTGPLYFIYKIIHAIKIANELNTEFSNYKFVPIYYMGSEDADLDELGSINIQHKKLSWQTNQTGAVGRMKVDISFIKLIDEIEAQIAVNAFGKDLINIFREAYQLEKSIQECTFELVNILFGKYGLITIIPDNKLLKSTFTEVVEKELTTQFSHAANLETLNDLNKHYKLKQTGREINLFYLLDNHRERIEKEDHYFIVKNLYLKFSVEEILYEIKNYPERFSANVILRPVFQETILPNIVFVGGGGEVTYWLELKKVFEATNTTYPLLILRNSFLIFQKNQANKLNQMNLTIEDLFKEAETLFSNWVKQKTPNAVDIKSEVSAIKNVYSTLKNKSDKIDLSLNEHITALEKLATNKLENLEKKIFRAEKRKYSDQKNQLENLKKELFFNNNLQEREENFSYFFSKYGFELFDILLESSKTFEQQFTLIEM